MLQLHTYSANGKTENLLNHSLSKVTATLTIERMAGVAPGRNHDAHLCQVFINHTDSRFETQGRHHTKSPWRALAKMNRFVHNIIIMKYFCLLIVGVEAAYQ